MRVILANFLAAILAACSVGCVVMPLDSEDDHEAQALDAMANAIEVFQKRLDGPPGPSADHLRRAAENLRETVKRDYTVGAALCAFGALTSFLVGRRLASPPDLEGA